MITAGYWPSLTNISRNSASRTSYQFSELKLLMVSLKFLINPFYKCSSKYN